MPTPLVISYAKRARKPVEAVEKIWHRAKDQAKAIRRSDIIDKDYWRLVNGLVKKELGLNESLTFKTFLNETIDQKTNKFSTVTFTKTKLQDMADDFKKAYSEDILDVFRYIREQVIFMSGDLKSITYWGADFKDSFKTADDLESWILQYVVPKLKDSKWPKPHTKVINDVLHELKVEILNNDPATKDR